MGLIRRFAPGENFRGVLRFGLRFSPHAAKIVSLSPRNRKQQTLTGPSRQGACGMRSPAHTIDFRALLLKEVKGATRALRGDAPSPEDVHRCRVHLKRARALGKVGYMCAPGLSGSFNDIARNVMHAMSGDRDLVALSETARAQAKASEKRSHPKRAAALRTVAEHLETEQARSAGPDWRYVRAGLADLAALANVWPEASVRQLKRGLKRITRNARDAFRKGQGAKSAQLRHKWRRREKERLYASDLLKDAWLNSVPRRHKRNEKLGAALGKERDVLLLLERIEATTREIGGEKIAKRARRALKQRRAEIARSADALGRKLHRGRG